MTDADADELAQVSAPCRSGGAALQALGARRRLLLGHFGWRSSKPPLVDAAYPPPGKLPVFLLASMAYWTGDFTRFFYAARVLRSS